MKKIISVLTAAFLLVCCVAAASAAGKAYTFSGFNLAKPSSTEDVENAKLTDEITVTTGGLMNWKAAAVTDIDHNNECGFYPIGGGFNPTGSYIYLAVGNSNTGSLFTLNLPKIEKGSEVTLTFAKPVITNNGSTRRNENDPYAYFKIADRYISINGGDFDTWRTASIVTGEDTDTIEFFCDQWGAVAIQKIEIKTAKNAELHDLNIKTTQYANLNVNGIKFYADADGNLTVPSLSQGEEVKITAQKDGYKDAETTVKINGDTSAEIYPECELNAVYYESDFGVPSGVLELESYDLNIEAKPVTRFFGEVTFTDGGELSVVGDNAEAVKISKKADGIYAGDTFITAKDNMEFELFFDKDGKCVTLWQNEMPYKIDGKTDFGAISKITGKNATMDYLGVSYPDVSKITIEGPDTVVSFAEGVNMAKYTAIPEYDMDAVETSWSFNGEEPAHQSSIQSRRFANFIIPAGLSGKVRVEFKYGGYTAYKDVNVVPNPKIIAEHSFKTMNYNADLVPLSFLPTKVNDEFGNDLTYSYGACMRDFKSSDENVIKVDDEGKMTAVGVGKATITANIYTGQDNIMSAEYTVDRYAYLGTTEKNVTYIANDLVKNDNITGYKIFYGFRTKDYVNLTDIPAATITADGYIIKAIYWSGGQLSRVDKTAVRAGDKTEISSEYKKIYLWSDGKLEQITEADTTMEGFEIKGTDVPETYIISPVYTFKNIGDVAEGKTLDADFMPYYYDITFKKAEPKRGDILVNGAMVGNNVDQADADRKVTDGAIYKAERLWITDGKISVSMTDGSTMLDYVTVETSDNIDSRVFVIGDSLACEYYGDFEKEVGGGRSGWGQQLESFLNVPVTNLANSGQYAKGLYDTAFPGVMKYGRSGDILLIECGYNDRNYSTRKEMTESVKSMIEGCRSKGIRPILVTPNASKHDYKESVAWSSYLKDVAIDMNCDIIDLSKMSYDFLYSLYGDDKDDVVTNNYNLTSVGGDTLHSSYAGAYLWASMVAQGMKDLGYTNPINTDFSYTFTDTLGNEITAQVK